MVDSASSGWHRRWNVGPASSTGGEAIWHHPRRIGHRHFVSVGLRCRHQLCTVANCALSRRIAGQRRPSRGYGKSSARCWPSDHRIWFDCDSCLANFELCRPCRQPLTRFGLCHRRGHRHDFGTSRFASGTSRVWPRFVLAIRAKVWWRQQERQWPMGSLGQGR